MAAGGDSYHRHVNWLCQCFRSTHTGDHQRRDIIDEHRPGQLSVDAVNWTNRHDLRSQRKRSDIFHAIVRKEQTEELSRILETGWDVNEILEKTGHLYFTTSLHEAARQGWTEGVKMLSDVGARYMTPGKSETPLQLALQNPNCSVDIVELLLKQGAGAKLSKKDSPCLAQAMKGIAYNDNFMQIVQLLLQNGADPNVAVQLDSDWIRHVQSNMNFTYRAPYKMATLAVVLVLLANPVSRVVSKVPDGSSLNVDKVKELRKANAEMFKCFVNSGADVNSEMSGMRSLFHTMAVFTVKNHFLRCYTNIYLPEHLDVFYQNGRNINMVYSDRGTVLEYTVRNLGHSNSVRWLIRHGAIIPPSMILMLDGHLTVRHRSPILHQQLEETPLILLQAGMRVSRRVHVHLMDIEKDISAWQEQVLTHGYTDDSFSAEVRAHTVWAKLKKEVKKNVLKFKNHTLLQYLQTQMLDLEDFSDESLQVYPEIDVISQTNDKMTFVLGQIHKVLEFLSQPQSLQWYCRRCARENLVSLQPSIVKTLPVPAQLKRYILCHEI